MSTKAQREYQDHCKLSGIEMDPVTHAELGKPLFEDAWLREHLRVAGEDRSGDFIGQWTETMKNEEGPTRRPTPIRDAWERGEIEFPRGGLRKGQLVCSVAGSPFLPLADQTPGTSRALEILSETYNPIPSIKKRAQEFPTSIRGPEFMDYPNLFDFEVDLFARSQTSQKLTKALQDLRKIRRPTVRPNVGHVGHRVRPITFHANESYVTVHGYDYKGSYPKELTYIMGLGSSALPKTTIDYVKTDRAIPINSVSSYANPYWLVYETEIWVAGYKHHTIKC